MKLSNVAQRFWSKVRVLGPDECWLWLAATKGVPGKRYGNFWNGQRHVGAHCFAWTLDRGSIPTGMWVLHRCDVMLCVNPRHLFIGTAVDNNLDMAAKDRVRFGNDHWAASLSEDDIGSIVARVKDGESQRHVAATYGINQSVVSRIMAGKAWRRAPRTFDPRREIDSMHDAMRYDRAAKNDPYLAKALRT